MQKKENKKTWYQIEIDDDISGTSGNELMKLLERLDAMTQVKFIVVDDLEGAMGEVLNSSETPGIYSFLEFSGISKYATQFEWGYFFLFSGKENAEKLIATIKSKEPTRYDYVNIPDTLTTVRVFDNTSFIIYTNNPKIAATIGKQYPAVKIENKTLEQLEFYY